MPKIQILSPLLVNQIAAGECIERPASIVKELVENSIDAGSDTIKIEIEDGGIQFIKIMDNGHGIAQDDLPLTIVSHATSKLKSVEDLLQIQTLGFRGEALASIASVADISICSREPESSSGFKIRSQGGNVNPIEPMAMNQGTTIEVHELFFNVPARRKFLKKGSTEKGYIKDTLIKLAMASPKISFQLVDSGKNLLRLEISDLPERLEKILAIDKESFMEVAHEHAGIKVKGYIVSPEFSRPHTKQQFFYINHRSLKDKVISRALADAYSDYLPQKRHPIAILFLDIAPGDVDVNVHPTKAEVRYRDGSSVYSAVYHAVLSSLNKNDLTHSVPLFDDKVYAEIETNKTTPIVENLPNTFNDHEATVAKKNNVEIAEPKNLHSNEESKNLHLHEEHKIFTKNEPATVHYPETRKPESFYVKEQNTTETLPESRTQLQTKLAKEILPPQQVKPLKEKEKGKYKEEENFFSKEVESSSVRWFQIHDSYIILETPEGLEIIDQHALHERVIYSNLKQDIQKQKIISQQLLFPISVRLTATEMETFQLWQQQLQNTGIEAEVFGEDVVIRSIPQLLGSVDGEDLLRNILSQLESKRKISLPEIFDSILETMACKAAVKAGDNLNPEEIISLIKRKESADNPFYCPHGRPTTLKVTLKELEKHFKRR